MNKLIFLGTGAAASLDRQMTGLCFVVGDCAFLIDCGDGTGTLRQLVKAGVPLSSINDIFITHKHRDHIMGVPSLLFHNILIGKNREVRIYGPKQALDILEYIVFETHTYDDAAKKRVAFEPLWSHQVVSLRTRPKTTVTGVLLTHQDPELECYAYIVSIGGMRVAFTGDMEPDPVFENAVGGVDIIVHECFGVSQNSAYTHSVRHSTAKDAGTLAAKASAKTLILTHLPPKDILANEELLLGEARKYFSGEIILAKDLLELRLS